MYASFVFLNAYSSFQFRARKGSNAIPSQPLFTTPPVASLLYPIYITPTLLRLRIPSINPLVINNQRHLLHPQPLTLPLHPCMRPTLPVIKRHVLHAPKLLVRNHRVPLGPRLVPFPHHRRPRRQDIWFPVLSTTMYQHQLPPPPSAIQGIPSQPPSQATHKPQPASSGSLATGF